MQYSNHVIFYLLYSLMSNRGMNGDVMSGRNRRGGSKSRLLSPPPSSAGNNNTAASVSNQVLSEGSIARVRGSSAERLLSPPPVTSPGVVNGHHGKLLETYIFNTNHITLNFNRAKLYHFYNMKYRHVFQWLRKEFVTYVSQRFSINY